ncbi:MAG: PIN domain-containing protein [Synergistaceae bacterium]|nr:PIN domain-containing protein [Synergistaceae bacterium]
MKALIDTNVILDAIAAREPFRRDAEKIIMLIAAEEAEGYITANSVTDIYYIARKHLPENDAREALRRLFCVFSIIDVRGDDCLSALSLPVDDFEDAVLTVCGYRAGVDLTVVPENFCNL